MTQPTDSIHQGDQSMGASHLSVVDSAPLRYLQSVPSGDPPEPEGWPVLCFLHGYDEASPLPIREGVTRHGPLRPGSSPQATDGFLVIAPQLPRAGDSWHAYADAVQQIIGGARRGLGGDPRRTYLSGFSFGGNGVFDLAAAQPGFWAALWSVDPTRIPHSDPQRPVWLSFGQAARRGQQAFIAALNLQSVEDSPSGEGAAIGGDRLYLDQGQDHVGSATLAFRDPRIYDWLLSKRLPVSPSAAAL